MRTTIRGPRPGEEPPFERHDETPLRVLLTAEPEVAQATSAMLAETYGVDIPASVVRDDIAAALFGAPDEDGQLQPLTGTYTTQVRVALAGPEDSLGRVRTVVGGTVFGLLGQTAAAATWPKDSPSACPSRSSSDSQRPP